VRIEPDAACSYNRRRVSRPRARSLRFIAARPSRIEDRFDVALGGILASGINFGCRHLIER
jgi:hypothetical protein